MADCCETHEHPTADSLHCPGCHQRGASVEIRAVKALLSEAALARLECVGHRFCRTPSCAVVYYDEGGRTYPREEIRVGVWHKEPYGDRRICYCFGETESTIRTEIQHHRASTAVQRVRAHIEAARCACDVRNPRGVCCLGDLTLAVQRVSGELVAAGEVP